MKKVATYIRVSDHSNSQEALLKQQAKVDDFCRAKGYDVDDTIAVVGDRQTGYPMLMQLLDSAKEKGIEKIVVASANRIVGSVDELNDIQAAFVEAGIGIETLDGSHQAVNAKELISTFLARAGDEWDAELADGQGSPVMKME